MALNINTFLVRTSTAIVFVAVLLLGICYNYFTFSGLFFVVSIWGLIEFYQIAKKLGAKPYLIPSIISGISFFAMAIFDNLGLNFAFYSKLALFFAVCSTASIFISALFDASKSPILNIAFSITGLTYTVLPFSLLLYTSTIDSTDQSIPTFNFHYVLGVIFLIWVNDALAYIVGSLMGKHKLFERISPGKTWEGTIGGALLTIASAFVIHNWVPELALIHWLVIAAIVSVFGTVGDLIESLFKRQAGIKDSGKIMPGHGGILDRFDSLIFVSPIVYAYLKLII